MSNIKISIIMGVYNCAQTLSEAIESIMNQTNYNWELIICDDGSSDDTFNISAQYQELSSGKIRILRNETNKGLSNALNECLRVSSGEYIARMDGDDVSLAHRLEVQANFLDQHLECDFVSSAMIYFDESGDWGISKPIPIPTNLDLLKGSPFAHAPCMIRKKAITSVQGYSERKHHVRIEDYDLWFRLLSKGSMGCNLAEPLYKMRDDRNAYHRRKYRYRINEFLLRIQIMRKFYFPPFYIVYVIKPLIVGLLPYRFYSMAHRNRLRPTDYTKD